MELKTTVFNLVLILGLIFIISSVQVEGISCCVDSVSGCYDIFTSLEESNCAGTVDFDKRCRPNPLDPTEPVTTNPICQNEVCCCYDNTKTFTSNLNSIECSDTGGIPKSGDNCEAVCAYDVEPEKVTCTSLNGYYCNPDVNPPEYQISLDSQVNDYSDRLNGLYRCYSLPCKTDDESCVFGPAKITTEIYCADGKTNDQDCLVDDSDPDCGSSVSGQVTIKKGFSNYGVSNVKIKIERLEDEIDGLWDPEIFFTYTVGQDGKYRYVGLPAGDYEVTVSDKNYVPLVTDTSEKIHTFTIQPVVHMSKVNFVVTLKDSGTVNGIVVSRNSSGGTSPVSNAIVVLDNTDHYTLTTENGGFIFDNVKFASYQLIAFKEGFFPKKKAVTVNQNPESVGIIELDSTKCDLISPPPIIESLENIPGLDHVKISFSPDGCNPDWYGVKRCDVDLYGTDCNIPTSPNYESVSDKINPAFNSIVDKGVGENGLGWGKTYNYVVDAYIDGKPSTPESFSTIYTGDEKCKGSQNFGEFCIFDIEKNVITGEIESSNSSRMYCSNNNLLIPIETCSPNSKCFEIDSGTINSDTVCRDYDACEPDEDNFFGLFFTKETCQGDNNERFCVFDSSKSAVDDCFSCALIEGCTDYKSESACVGDRNNVGNPCGVGNCEWEDTDKELNQGICFEKEEADCSSCDNPFNKVFGVCSETSCSILGDCGLSKLDGSCLDCEDMTCYGYATKDFCGGKTSISLNDDNTFNRGSGDSCSLQSCIWDESGPGDSSCKRDADGDGDNDDCGIDFIEGDDRRFAVDPVYTYDDCIRDNTPPKTVAILDKTDFNPLEPINGKINVRFRTEDTISGSREIFESKDVYFCIEPEGENNCKRGTFNKAYNDEGEFHITIESIDGKMRISPGDGDNYYTLRGGRNILKYYGKDFGSNLEIVKSVPFNVDFLKPVVELTVLKNPQFGEQKTDLTIIANANEDVYCYIEVSDCEQVGNCDPNVFDENNVTEEFINEKRNEFDSFFTRQFYNLEDGVHFLNVVCTDTSGNIFKSAEEVILDADSRIFAPRPKGITDKRDVTLSVMTVEDVTCKYSSELNQDYESMTNIMASSKTGKYYAHTAGISASQDDQYVYYVRCDYEPVALEKISFSVDTQEPNVNALIDAKFEIPESGWVQSANVHLICEDLPEFGFGCNSSYYCLRDPLDLKNAGIINSCTPDTLYENPLNLEKPQSLCYYATEAIYTGNGAEEGGKVTEVKCANVFVDRLDPTISVYGFISTTNVNNINIKGAVFDSVEKGSLSFSETEDYSLFFDVFDNAEYSVAFSNDVDSENFDYSLDIDFSSLGNKINDNYTSELRILLGNESTYGALVFDLDDGVIKFSKFTSFGESVQESISVSKDFYSGPKTIRISYNNNKLKVFIQSTNNPNEIFELETNYYNKVNAVGALIKDSDEGEFKSSLSGSFSNIFLLTPDTTLDLDKKVKLKINNELRSLISTQYEFEFNEKLTTGTPFHGARYDVSVYAEDISGRTSQRLSNTVIYDLSGPNFKSFDYEPIGEQESGYLEFGFDSTFFIKAGDDFSGVSRVIAKIGDVSSELNEENGEWTGIVKTSSLPIGLNDLELEMYDGLGNKNVHIEKDALLIEDKIDPAIKLDFEKLYFNTSTPLIHITTDEAAKCSLSYTDANGLNVQMDFDTGLTFEHYAQLVQPLNSEINGEIENKIIVECVDGSDNFIKQQIIVVIDLRSPIYTVQTQNGDLWKHDVTRHEASYLGYKSIEKSLFFNSDEPVICKYSSDQDSGYGTASYDLFSNSFLKTNSGTFSESDITNNFYFSDKKSKSFDVICKDRAGNVGKVKALNFATDFYANVHLFELPEVIKINNNSVREDYEIDFRSVRKLDCELSLDDSGFFQMSREQLSSVSFSYTYDLYESLKDFSGVANIEILCKLEEESLSPDLFEINVIRDLDAPELSLNEQLGDGINDDLGIYTPLFNVNEPVSYEIYNNEKLVSVSPFGIPLTYGYNELKFIVEDSAGNTAELEKVILSTKQRPKIYISNSLAGSSRDSFKGNILISTTAGIAIPSLILEGSQSQKTIILDSPTISGNYNNYAFEISREELNALVGVNNNVDLDLLEIEDPYVAFEVYLDGGIAHSEILNYNPYAESVLFFSPQMNLVQGSELENYNGLKIIGNILQENYISDVIYQYGSELSEKSFDYHVSKFNFTEPVVDGQNKMYLELVNDLGVSTIINTEFTKNMNGPNPTVFIYPSGSVAYYNLPQFQITYDSPAKVQEAYITNDELEGNYGVFSSNLFVFEEILKTTDELPEPGNYILHIISVDESGMEAETNFNFNYVFKEFELELISPKYGVSSVQNFEVVLKSDRPAMCKYSLEKRDYNSMNKITLDFGINHIFNISVNDTKTVYVQCEEFGGKISDVNEYNFTYDNIPPVINNFELLNSKEDKGEFITEYPLEARFKITASEDVYCRYDYVEGNQSGLANNFEQMSDVSIRECASINVGRYCFNNEQFVNIPNLNEDGLYFVSVMCQDKGGLDSNLERHDFEVDISQGKVVRIESPADYENSKNVVIAARTNSPNNDCKYGFSKNNIKTSFRFNSNDSLYHSHNVTLDSYGTHELWVKCTLNDVDHFDSKTFIVDNTPPKTGTIITKEVVASLTTLQATAVNFTDNESKIQDYIYAVGTTPCGRKGYNSVLNWTQSKSRTLNAKNLELFDKSTYYFCVKARNGALLESKEVSSRGILIDLSILRTNTSIPVINTSDDSNNAPTCSDGITNGDETGRDCGESCQKACPEGTFCTEDIDCYSSDMGCILNECVFIADDDDDSDDTNKVSNMDVEDPDDVNTTKKKSLAWLYWLFAVLLIAILGGGGYYAYVVYKDDDKNKDGTVNNAGTMGGNSESPFMAQRRAESLRQQEIAEKKNDVKKALKKKLVEDLKKETHGKRSDMFDQFSSEGKESVTQTTSNDAIKGKDISEKVQRLKQALHEKDAVNSEFNYHPQGENISDINIQDAHKDVVFHNLGSSIPNKASSSVLPVTSGLSSRKSKKEKSSLNSLKSFNKSKAKAPSSKSSSSSDKLKALSKNNTSKVNNKSKESNLSKLKSKSVKENSEHRAITKSSSKLEDMLGDSSSKSSTKSKKSSKKKTSSLDALKKRSK